MHKILLAMAIGTVLGTGCAPAILGAQQVGDVKDATWVYLKTDDKDESGIFRCAVERDDVVCRRAKVKG